jgi:VanZ family protein
MGLEDLPDSEKVSLWRKFLIKWKGSIEKDKLAHYKLGFLVAFPFVITGGFYFGELGFYLSLVIGVIFGVGIEVYQSTTPNRFVEFNDATATVCGSLTTYLLCKPLIWLIIKLWGLM